MINNLNYTKGSIVYLKCPELDNTSMRFLNGRPLIVVSRPVRIFDTISVVSMTTQNRPGIKITVRQLNNDYIRESTVQPWAVYSINPKWIDSTNGIIDITTMKAIDKAIAYHLGLTNEIPEYLKSMPELCGVVYSMATPENIKSSFECDECNPSTNLKVVPKTKRINTKFVNKPLANLGQILAEEVKSRNEISVPTKEVKIVETEEERALKRFRDPEVRSPMSELYEYLYINDPDGLTSMMLREITVVEYANKHDIPLTKLQSLAKYIIRKYGDVDEISSHLAGDGHNCKTLPKLSKLCLSVYMDVDDLKELDNENKIYVARYVNTYRKKMGVDLTATKWRKYRKDKSYIDITKYTY